MEIQKLTFSDRRLKKALTPLAPTIYSETVCLRQILDDDAQSILISKCHDDIIKTIAWESPHAFHHQDLTWASQDVVSGETFGSITLTELNPICAEVEFTFHCDRWKKRLSFESLRLILDWAFTRFPQYKRIQARCLPTNPTSGALLDNLGMRLEGVNRAAFQIGERVFDLSCHAMTREDWALRQEDAWSFRNYDFAHI
jgi:RimJ/RimL family protein N-acetyltransferase